MGNFKVSCPRCMRELINGDDKYTCASCNAVYPVKEGVGYFAPEALSVASSFSYEDYRVEIQKIRNGESGHFWFIARRDFIIRIFMKFISRAANVLEVGAGTGYIAEALVQNGYKMTVGEIHDQGVRYIHERLPACNVCQFDLMSPPFRDQFDTVCLFDVLEHIEDDEVCIMKLGLLLKNNNTLKSISNWLLRFKL